MKKIAFIVACIVVLCFFTASLEAAPIRQCMVQTQGEKQRLLHWGFRCDRID